MKTFQNTFIPALILVLSLNGQAQLVSSANADNDLFIYIGNDDIALHLVWEEHPVLPIKWYVVEKSYNGNLFFSVDSIQPVNLFDIHANNYPDDRHYYDRILYSTEIGSGRFIYNNVRGIGEAGEKNFWYRVRMILPDGKKIYTKTVMKSLPFGIADIERLREIGDKSGSGGVSLGGDDLPDVAYRRSACPNAQMPPSGYIFTGGVRTFYGECCYWEEREYMTQQITEACNGVQAWCCPRDCVPLAWDPCCYHICSEYHLCSCHPWTCCDVSNATIWVVHESNTYSIDASVQAIQHPRCNGNFDGMVSVNNGGLAPITYAWSNGSGSGGILNQLAAGIYSLTITDGIGCSETLSFTLVDPSPLASTLSVSDVTCFGFNDGAINVSVSGGTLPYTYTWSGGTSNGANTQDLTGIGPGNYALTITDANNCVNNHFTPLLSPDEFEGVVTFLDLGCLNAGSAVLELCCYGSNTGSAVLSLSGGTSPNSFIWSNGITDVVNEYITAGNYSVTAVDGNGCSFIASSTLGERDEMHLSSVTSNAACGQCNGTANIVVNGGSGLFNFQWPSTTGNQTTASVTGLCAGSYTALVSDAFAVNCSKPITVTISNYGGETITVSKTDASCVDACNGNASVSFNCASPPCAVSWFDPMGALLSQNNSVSNLCGGEYSVEVRNAAGCITAQTVEILQGTAIDANLSFTSETCPNTCDGSASAAPTGGSPPYAFQWLDAGGVQIPSQTNSSITGLCPGNYQLRILDAAGCEVTEAFSISPNIFSIATAQSGLLCHGVCDGSATVDMTGGSAPFSFQWFDSNNNSITGETNRTIFNLCPGTYYVQVTSSANCALTSSAIVFDDPLEITATVSAADILCSGDCDGSATVTVGGGTGGYTYQWYNAGNIPIAGETSDHIINLCDGTYYVVATDANDCASPPQPAVVSVITVITTTLSFENISCHDENDGTINLTVNGGAPPLSFSWNNGAYSTQNLSNLSEGTYAVLITDAGGCTASNSATIINPDPLIAFATPHVFPHGFHVSCTDGTNGRATVTVSGGTAPLTYLWNDGQQAPTALGLSLDVYTVTVIDARGCQISTSVTLDQNPPPLLTMLVADTFFGGWNVSCFGASDGFIDLTVINGTPPFVYEWLPGNIVFIEDLDSVSAGTYTVYVTDTANGCNTIDSIALIEPPPFDIAFSPLDASCFGGHDGAIVLDVTGGTPGYAFSWNGGSTTSQNLNGLTAGLYSVVVTDANDCVITDSVFINQPTIIPFGNIYIGTCRDSFFAGGSFQTNSGLYYDTLKYGAGCDSVVVTDLEFVANFFVTDSVSICEGNVYFVGGSFQTQGGIYLDTLIASGNCDSIVQTNLSLLPSAFTPIPASICRNEYYFAGGGNQFVSGIYYDTIMSANGCDSIIETTLIVVDWELRAQPDSAAVQEGGIVNFSVTSGTGNVAYSWFPSAGLSCNNTECSNVTIQAVADVTYTVIGVDETGCSDTSTIFIRILSDTLGPDSELPMFYVPNAFSPNGDAVNDEFRVWVSGFTDFRMIIFDRWGEKLFESRHPETGWDGTFRGKLVNSDVYIYYLDISFENGIEPPDYSKFRKGSITLLR